MRMIIMIVMYTCVARVCGFPEIMRVIVVVMMKKMTTMAMITMVMVMKMIIMIKWCSQSLKGKQPSLPAGSATDSAINRTFCDTVGSSWRDGGGIISTCLSFQYLSLLFQNYMFVN